MLVFLSLSLMSCRSASRSLPSGLFSFKAADKHRCELTQVVLLLTTSPQRAWRDAEVTCTFPWLAVVRSVSGKAGRTSAAVALFQLFIVVVREHAVVRRHCGQEGVSLTCIHCATQRESLVVGLSRKKKNKAIHRLTFSSTASFLTSLLGSSLAILELSLLFLLFAQLTVPFTLALQLLQPVPVVQKKPRRVHSRSVQTTRSPVLSLLAGCLLWVDKVTHSKRTKQLHTTLEPALFSATDAHLSRRE